MVLGDPFRDVVRLQEQGVRRLKVGLELVVQESPVEDVAAGELLDALGADLAVFSGLAGHYKATPVQREDVR